MTSENRSITVIGCGVIGLTSAVALQDAGFTVNIVTSAMPPNTTSNAAAAIWYPYKAYPEDRVFGWGKTALETFYTLMEDSATGVSEVALIEIFKKPTSDPWWKDAVRHFERVGDADLPSGYVDGFRIRVPMVETPIFLRYLINRFEANGGTITMETVSSLETFCQQSENGLIINCTGMGARDLVGDEELYPIRGQVMRVTNVEVPHALIDDSDETRPTYIIPRQKDIVLGGSAEAYSDSRAVDLQLADDIWKRAVKLVPALKESMLVGAMVGLRPARSEVRLESERLGDNCAVIHNYGHGGAGFTLSWGCAQEVVSLARDLVKE